MDTRILDKKINRAYKYNFFLGMGIFVLFLSIALIGIQMTGVMLGKEDEELIRLITIGATAFSVLIIGVSCLLITKKKNYSKLLQVDEQAVTEIIEDTHSLELNTTTFAFGRKYAYFYGKLIRNQRGMACVKYEEISCAEFAKWNSDEQIFFYDNDDAWIATVGGYKHKSQMIKDILTSKGVSIK